MKMAVVGLGGIGSQVVEQLFVDGQAMLQFADLTRGLVELHLIDHDVVEEKNLENQQYRPCDVKRPKASAAAALVVQQPEWQGLQVRAYTQQVQDAVAVLAQCNLIVCCVDNVEAREAVVRSTSRAVLIMDLGAEGLQGSIRFYNWYFADFLKELFAEGGPQPVCQSQQEAALVRPRSDQIITHRPFNRLLVNKGLIYLKRVLNMTSGAPQPAQPVRFDLVHISYVENYFENEIPLRQDVEGELVHVDLRNGRIVRWDRLKIQHEDPVRGSVLMVI